MRHYESKVSCPRTQHSDPGQGSNTDRLIWSTERQPLAYCLSHAGEQDMFIFCLSQYLGVMTSLHIYLLKRFLLLLQGMAIHSSIIQGNGFFISQLSRFMEPVAGSNSQWRLCYRASSHGWAASTFHSKCDGKRHTVTIIRKDQFVFGGYVDIPWGMNII